ncbi:hypothetical protein [Clostridium manihotivorum]|uniref:Uncharacterized protein n=1 Tax=Clostridium manihotivorum TaxID=2320868 RepID=A0A3R5QUK3_9CLOT|nr:hypothetical protein [Clostridium manihotivorum]QAA32703.1 hypothetical protein C1I91_14260 [Clostridium manihotivorum]
MYITQKEARIHNLINRFCKNYSIEELKDGFTADELSNRLFFRQEDFNYVIEENILILKNEKYMPTEKLIKQFTKIKGKLKKEDETLEALKMDYKRKFEELINSNNYEPTKEIIELAYKIHWYILPEYEEYMIVNSEIYPNENTKDYYNHYHTLEDLYNELLGNGKNIASKKGDMNLNKDIKIAIYSRRWGHDDYYRIARTTTGWKVSFHQTREGSKEGEALIKHLEHDSISYPNSLSRFMLDLWNKADSEEMSIEDLKEYLESITMWINVCEKNTPENIEV